MGLAGTSYIVCVVGLLQVMIRGRWTQYYASCSYVLEGLAGTSYVFQSFVSLVHHLRRGEGLGRTAGPKLHIP